MRTFAHPPKAPRQAAPAKSTILARPLFRQIGEADSSRRLRRSIADQAVQPMVRPILEGSKAGSSDTARPWRGHDFSRVPLFSPTAMQKKLTIDQPGDVYEQEADRVVEQVMCMAPPAAIGPTAQAVQRKGSAREDKAAALVPSPGEEEKPQIQRMAHGVGGASQVASNFASRLGAGAPLDAASRAYFEPRFGHDFSQVRVHHDARAADSARAVHALAYTVGHDVVFGAGQHSPGTTAGRRLLAHELTHVVQQDREYTDDSGVMQRSPLECSQRFPQTLQLYGGIEGVATRTLILHTGGVDPTTVNNFQTLGLKAFKELQDLIRDNSLTFDTTKDPQKSGDCIRYPYPLGNALGLEAVELCQEGAFVKFKFICVDAASPAEEPITGVQREAREMVNELRKNGKEVVINLGGEAAESELKQWPYAVNLNPTPRVAEVPNLVREPAGRLGELFEAGSADKVVSNRLPKSALSGENLDKVAKGAFDVLRKGGEIDMHIYGGHPGFQAALERAGFDPANIQNESNSYFTAIK
jgi:Domain of unknown function (DUF4157)